MKTPILKGKNIVLRPLDLKQAANYVRWLKDREINKFLSADFTDLNLRKEKEYIKRSNQDKRAIRWGIFMKSGEHIGTTALHDIDMKQNLSAIWGIFIGEKNYWGKGLGTDTLKTVLKFSFNKLKLNRIELLVFPFNKRAIKCYKKCGFKIEGRNRQTVRKRGRFLDDIVMGLIRSDYKKFKNK